jgi:16S rRNA (cytidine1402-2'-O)-methyltransferase
MASGDPGTLYLCATPIGNLEDITLRALRILGEADLIAAEDTRRTRKLLARYDIHTELTSYYGVTERERAGKLIDRLLAGDSVALVSDAGTPGISDPGHELVKRAIEAGVPVVPIPGPSAVMSALIISGLPTRRFRFEGFLPRAKRERRAMLRQLKAECCTLVFFEAPHRLRQSLWDILDCLGDRRMAIVRELTKTHEEVLRCTVAEAVQNFEQRQPRGEFTLIIAGAGPEPSAQETEDTAEDVTARLRELLGQGMSTRDAVRAVVEECGVSRSRAYHKALELNREAPPDAGPGCA